jgi:acyl-CoA thioesterase-1
MKCRGLALVMAAALAGCGDNEAAAPERATVSDAAAPAVEVTGPERRILAFGDSLFAGYGVEAGESYPAQLEATLRGQGLNVRVTNAGVSGDTTAAGLARIEFVLDSLDAPPDLAIVELGGNDLLRGIAPAETRSNLNAILAELKERGIPVLLMGMRAPPNLGEALVPFFLEPVWDKPALIQEDRVHPTAEGIEALVAATADDVARALPED